MVHQITLLGLISLANTALRSTISLGAKATSLLGRLRAVALATLMGLSLGIPYAAANAAPSSATPAAIPPSDIPSYIQAKTQIAISNYPLFLLSEAVTHGAPSGKLLLDKGDIGHHGSLSPSAIKTIKDSRYVLWFGKQLETNLAKPLAQQPNTISLFGLKGFYRQPLRDVQGKPITGTLDPHIWLEPNNAKAITRALAAIYSRANPKYQQVYSQNVQAFAKKMDAAVASVANGGTNTKRPYWAYHDAFQYIEPSLNLAMVGAVTTDHHLPPKASQLRWLNNNRPQKTMCVLLQNDSNPGVLSKLQPVTSTVQQEDMSFAKDFVSGWLTLAKQTNRCIDEAAA